LTVTALADHAGPQPYADGAPAYLASGWQGVLPLGFRGSERPEPRRKANPPKGYSGDDGAWPERAQIATWVRSYAELNIGLRLPSDIIGIDVDAYVSAESQELKLGDKVLERLEAEHGALPATWRSSSRGAENPSGVRLFRVPVGTRLITAITGGIEIIQRHHRFVCCWPSIHPDPDPETGEIRVYEWYEPSGVLTEHPPDYDDIPDLPFAWIEGLKAETPPAAADHPPAEPQYSDFWDAKVQKDYDDALRALSVAAAGGRHDLATARACGFCRQEQLGYTGATSALEQFGAAFVDAVKADRADRGRDNGQRIAEAEWASIVDTGRAKVRTTESTKAVDESPFVGEVDGEGFFVAWPDFWTRESVDEEWLIEDVIALGRAHSIYASHKQGKSLYTLWSAAQVAQNRTDVDVVYLDYEMTEADLRERLEDMGYGPGSDFSRLHYALLPMLAPLDTLEGAKALLEIIKGVRRDGCHVYVVIDTTGRAVEGEENSNDTIRNFYRYTGSALKRAGVTWTRLDHAGKDATKGQRGGSAKGDDVDVVWKLQKGDNGMTLYCDASRMSWVPKKVTFKVTQEPLAYVPTPKVLPEGTEGVMRLLLELGVPASATVDTAMKALRAAGQGKRKTLVSAAVTARKEAPFHEVSEADLGSGTVREPSITREYAEPLGNQTPDIRADQGRNQTGTVGTEGLSHTVPGSPPLRGNRDRAEPRDPPEGELDRDLYAPDGTPWCRADGRGGCHNGDRCMNPRHRRLG
jgi:hypothetical protein